MFYQEVMFVLTILFCICVSIYGGTNSSGPPKTGPNEQYTPQKVSTYEKDLMADILTNYSTSFRPTTSNHKAVIVEFELKLNKIVKLDIKQQVMIINAKTVIKWDDPQLAWNRSKYNNTDYLNIPYSMLWTPDIMLGNTARDDSRSPSDMYKTKVQVTSKGTLIWVAPVTLIASCSINIKWFPFDSQSCTLSFGSQSYSESRLNLRFLRQPKNAAAMQGQFHVSNGDWVLNTLHSERRKVKYEWGHEPYTILDYTFDITRLYKYYLLYLVLPCLGLLVLAPFMFYIPAESGERTGFGITVVLSLSVYLLVISDKLPEKSDATPIIGALYFVMFSLLVLAVVFGIITTHLVYKTNEPPKWLWRVLFKRKKCAKRISNVVENEVNSDGLVLSTVEKKAYQRPKSGRKSPKIYSESIPELDVVEKNQQKWKMISAKLDKIMFYSYFSLVIVVPGIVLLIFWSNTQ